MLNPFLFIYRSSLSPSSPFRNWKILALCSLFLSAVSVTPMADKDINKHGELDPAIIIGRSVFTTRFILWRDEPLRNALHDGGTLKIYDQGPDILTWREKHYITDATILTSSGFPKAAANVLHSLFSKSSGNLLAGKLVSTFMNGILFQLLLLTSVRMTRCGSASW